jgi:apolipoprotein N-acyltransferase
LGRTTTGVGGVLAPLGGVVARCRGAGPELLAARVHRSLAVPPVQRWGDAPVLAACGVVGVSSWRGARGSRGARKGDAG